MSGNSIDRSREKEYQELNRFIQSQNAGTRVLLFKNGYGKTEMKIRAFIETEDPCFVSQTHKHIKSVIIPKLSDKGLQNGVDYVYYVPMEMICTTYQELKEEKQSIVLDQNEALADLFMPMSKRHEVIIKCTDPACPFTLQEWNISKDNPDRIRKIVSTVKMLVRKELQYKANAIFVDELDGTLDPQEKKCSETLYHYLQGMMGDSISVSHDELGRMPILNMFGRMLKNRENILSEIEAKREELQEKVLKGDMEAYDKGEVGDMNLLWQIATDGLLMADGSGKNEDWYFNEFLHRVPLLYEIADALTDQKSYLTKKIIVSMARMRKNPILKRKFKLLFDMLYQTTAEPQIDSVAYKEFKVSNLFPTYQGEDCEFPNDKWKIYVQKPSGRAGKEYLKKVFSEDGPESFTEFLKIDKQLSEIATRHNRQHGLLISYKSFVDWLKKIRGYTQEELEKCMDSFDENTRKKIKRAINSTKWNYLRTTTFGNGSSGTDMDSREKFLIVYGNWFSGEYKKFNGLFYPDKQHNYRLRAAEELPDTMKRELQILLMREYLEFPLRSRRKIPTYCITNYFQEEDKIAEKTNMEILEDYNVYIEFY